MVLEALVCRNRPLTLIIHPLKGIRMRGGPQGPPRCPNFDGVFDGFWRTPGAGTRENRFLVSKSPTPPMETCVRSYLIRVFENTRKILNFFLVFLHCLGLPAIFLSSICDDPGSAVGAKPCVPVVLSGIFLIFC